MINKLKLEISCVHCLESGEKEIYPIINGQKDLKAKKEIMDEDLFYYYCLHCGHYQRILYECVYYDPVLKYALILSSNGPKLLKKVGLDLKDYEIRFVSDVRELKEKIIIKENGLDDRIIEIMKHDLRTTLTSKASYDLVLDDNQGLRFYLIYPDNEIIKEFPFLLDEYQNYQKLYANYLDEYNLVDKTFAAKAVVTRNKMSEYH
ncbi:CpXC domain-containing protein [uncultured Thomasclavelia sp.]|uniref:CpXC domain-containing protein n=1 Tax=uncultured Thomasclavelia sp. TaxID=3025759 RepID=UPI0025DDD893|nr:CpXC domain-containing protein [uncultured Thomasclavelia sp.]